MILFKNRKIQKFYRVVIPPSIVDTLELKENNDLEILFDEKKREVIVKFK